MPIFLLPATLAVWTLLFCTAAPFRVALLRAVMLMAAFTVVVTEVASALNSVGAGVFAAAWAVALTVSAVFLWTRRRRISLNPPQRLSVVEVLAVGAISAILATVGYTAVVSPPNSADALSYHLPRVIYWIRHGNVSFYPTSYLNQIMLQPVAEYLMLHLYLLAGGDHFTNLVQFTAFAASIVGVSGLAGSLGLPRIAQILASLFCATLPNAILQASGAKNDLVLALWIVCSAWFLVRWLQERSKADLVFIGLAVSLAVGTKGTAYLFVPPVLAAAALTVRRPVKGAGEVGSALLIIIAAVLLINGPQFVRNLDLSGSAIGFDSAQGDGAFRWRNERLGWSATASNALRNLSEQLGARSDEWNQQVYSTVVQFHNLLGLDPNDRETTWRWTKFGPPRNSNHEADANNRWHLLLIAVGVGIAIVRRDRRWLLYSLGPIGGFAAFCFYLKWQPFFSRLELPLFVISAPLTAMALNALRPVLLTGVICLLLVSNTRLALLENWTRPLTGLHNIRITAREPNYFNDMVQWNNRDSYMEAVETVAATSCRLVGIDNSINHVEYPFQALLLARDPAVRFMHVGVDNSSAKYATAEQPCMVLCLDCADSPEKAARYAQLGATSRIGKFLLFSRN